MVTTMINIAIPLSVVGISDTYVECSSIQCSWDDLHAGSTKIQSIRK